MKEITKLAHDIALDAASELLTASTMKMTDERGAAWLYSPGIPDTDDIARVLRYLSLRGALEMSAEDSKLIRIREVWPA